MLKSRLNQIPESWVNIPERDIESMIAKMKKRMGNRLKMTKNNFINIGGIINYAETGGTANYADHQSSIQVIAGKQKK